MGLSETALRELGEVTYWGVFTTDADLIITGWNRWLEMHSSLSAEHVVGRNLLEVFPAVAERRIERFYRQALEGKMVVLSQRLHKYVIPLPSSLPDDDEPLMQQSGHIAPLMSEGRIIGTLTLVEDVSDRVVYERELRARAMEQQAIAALSQEALSGEPTEALFRNAVLEATRILELDYCRIVELSGKNCPPAIVVQSDSPQPGQSSELGSDASLLFQRILASDEPVLLPGSSGEFDFSLPPELEGRGLQSGIEIPLRAGAHFQGSLGAYRSSPRRFSADHVRFLQSVVNVLGMASQRRYLESELRQHVSQLADADRRKNDFLAMLAHELRNPLAPIRHAVALLGFADLEEAASIEARQIIDRQVEHLVRLVDDLLDVARILRGRVELRREPVELAHVVNRAVETSRPLISSHRHKLSISLPPETLWVNGDAVRLAQVVSNLLNNSAKYTEPGGEIRLATERRGSEAVIRVRDNGVGIDPRFLPHVFDAFIQADRSIARSEGGLGIGLTLVRSVVELHDGRVSAASEGIGKGSEFAVELPLLSAAPTREKLEFAPSTSRPLRILVVDDHAGSAKLLSKLLSKFWGHEVEVAHDGHGALEVAEQFHPELVLLDIGLPGLSGLEVAERLRQLPATQEAMLVALTGYGQLEDRDRSRQAGFDEHLVKPASVNDLQRLFAHAKLK